MQELGLFPHCGRKLATEVSPFFDVVFHATKNLKSRNWVRNPEERCLSSSPSLPMQSSRESNALGAFEAQEVQRKSTQKKTMSISSPPPDTFFAAGELVVTQEVCADTSLSIPGFESTSVVGRYSEKYHRIKGLVDSQYEVRVAFKYGIQVAENLQGH